MSVLFFFLFFSPPLSSTTTYKQYLQGHVVNAAVNMEKEKVTSPGFTDGAMASGISRGQPTFVASMIRLLVTDKNIGLDTQSFHNDEGEILALYVRDGAETGGRTQIASGWHLYNVLAGKRPDIIKKLAENWVLDSYVFPLVGRELSLEMNKKRDSS